jgi:hypothetical protein
MKSKCSPLNVRTLIDLQLGKQYIYVGHVKSTLTSTTDNQTKTVQDHNVQRIQIGTINFE